MKYEISTDDLTKAVATVRSLEAELAAERWRWAALKAELRYGIVLSTTNILDGILRRMDELETKVPSVAPTNKEAAQHCRDSKLG